MRREKKEKGKRRKGPSAKKIREKILYQAGS